MDLGQIGEFGLIKKLSDGCLIRKEGIIKAIGDDAAAFITPSGEVVIVTTDMMVERVHFLRKVTSGFNLGYKSLAVNLSDIAAMGATAREAFISIAVPRDCSIEFIEDLYTGMKKLASCFNVNLLGGDTTGSRKDLIISITVVGSAPKDKILFRSGAKKGDIIFCTAWLGDSRAGCHLILNKIESDEKAFQVLKDAHLMPKPYLNEGKFLAGFGGVHAAIDISDGLSSDLAHIMEESQVGAQIYAEKIPLSDSLKTFCRHFKFDPVRFALAGGEDYALLFTVSPDQAKEIVKKYQEAFNNNLFEIGEITGSNQLQLVFPDGATEFVNATGWDHFKK